MASAKRAHVANSAKRPMKGKKTCPWLDSEPFPHYKLPRFPRYQMKMVKLRVKIHFCFSKTGAFLLNIQAMLFILVPAV